jgi:hypothetical protein
MGARRRASEVIGMKRKLAILVTAVYAAVAASSALAHHSHPYFYDYCKTVTVEGRIETVQFKDPHSLIVLRVDDGTAYTVDWNGLTGLTNNRIIDPAKAALVPGTRVVVTGHPIRSASQIREHFPDFKNDVNPNTVDPTLIRRVDDSWSWAARLGPNPPDCKGN